MKKGFMIFILLHAITHSAISQVNTNLLPENLFEEILEETEDEEESLVIFERLVEISENPFEINTVNAHELASLYILSDFQIFTFLNYREKYGRILSLRELSLIPGYSNDIITRLSGFLYAEEQFSSERNNEKSRFHKTKILYRTMISSPYKLGFNEEADSSSRFGGCKFYHLIKTSLEWNKNFRLGLNIEQDAGEKFSFNNKQKGFDYYSFFLEFKNPAKNIEKLIIGDYRLSTGLGLIHGYGLSSKSTDALIKQKFTEIKKYSSTAESGFFRGIAIQLGSSKLKSLLYFSQKKQSGNLEIPNDSLVFIRSRNLSGLHRNYKELETKNQFKEYNSGFSLCLRSKGIGLSYNLNNSHFNHLYKYRKLPDQYSEDQFSKNFFNHSIDYKIQKNRFFLAGEIALDKDQNLAIQQIINSYINPLLSLSIAYRYFDPGYISLHAKSFSESSAVRNEKGLYFALKSYPFRILTLDAYIDFYSFPWIRYGDTSPYSGNDLVLKGKWFLNKDFQIVTIFKQESAFHKENSENTNINCMQRITSKRYCIQTSYDLTQNINLKNKIEMKSRESVKPNIKQGLLMYQEVNINFWERALSINFRYTIFDIPSWDVRIYSWEPDLLYSFSTPAYYKAGQNILLNMRFKTKKINIGLKLRTVIYNNPYKSGSGTDKREGKYFTDIKWQWIYIL